MREETYDKNALTLLQGRVACKLAEIHQMLAPGICGPISAELLQEQADRHMDSLPPDEQEKLRLKALVAFAELQSLSAEMARQLNVLRDEMNKVTRHRRAALAYRQLPRGTGHGAARI
jgi:hypothetical protein